MRLCYRLAAIWGCLQKSGEPQGLEAMGYFVIGGVDER